MRKTLLFFTVFTSFSAVADNLLMSPVDNGCVTDVLGFTDDVVLEAVFEPQAITCPTGQYLPINTVNCEPCLEEATCVSGTYRFNETKNQGIVFDDVFALNKSKGCASNILGVHHEVLLEAMFEPKKILCAPGYYLSANNVECTQCPENNYCVGGTYTFNETEPQGILECSAGMFSPAGSWECYERILHVDDSIVYLKSHKITEPSLHVKYEDRVYYANMTTMPTVMNRDSTHSLKIKYNSTEYYVCDDTTYKSDSGI